jgi:hypothetical protein
MAEGKGKTGAETPETKKESKLVKVKVLAGVAFGGTAIRPIVDNKTGKVVSDTAIVPRTVAMAHQQRLAILEDAADEAKVGMIAPEAK